MTIQDTTPVSTPPARSNTLRTVLLVIGSLVLAFILIGTAFRIFYSLNREDTSGTFSVQEAFDEIEVRSSAADVDVEFTDVDRPQIRFDQGGTDLRLHRDVSGGVLTVRVDRPGWGWFGWGFGDWGWSGNARLKLSLPTSMQDDAMELRVKTTAGDLRVNGEFGDVDLESTAGNVRMTGAAGNMTISTTAGDVRLNGVAVEGAFRSNSTAGNGRFELSTLPASMDVESTAGDVRVSLPRGNYRIETSTTAGDVSQNVSSNPNSDRVYRFETTAGNIELNEG